jgi:aminoglycoside phosphotransferase (APT) family kinase protein
MRETTAGIDAARVDAWLARHVGRVEPPCRYALISGGRSNLTFEVLDAGGRRFVLRRPPLGGVLPSAHDMGREHRIISALGPTRVPVPAALGYCDDPDVNGAPFYVMDYVEGVVLHDALDVPPELAEPARARLGDQLVDVLAELAAVDPDAVGLGELGRRDGYVERQLKRWLRQFEQSTDRELPAIPEVHRRLSLHVPPQLRTGIVHGDFRLGNCIVGLDGSIRAVLDWELCTLGDTLADLGWLVADWNEPGESAGHRRGAPATTLPGFPPRSDAVARYAERTGADVSQLDFYVALALWKLACIGEGVYARYRAGVMGDDGSEVLESLGERVVALANDALAIAERLEPTPARRRRAQPPAATGGSTKSSGSGSGPAAIDAS